MLVLMSIIFKNIELIPANFKINEGDTLILLGNLSRGIAIAKYDDYLKFADAIIKAKSGENND